MQVKNFSVYKPMPGHDEDAPPFADDKILVICDGLGGGGQNRYRYDGELRSSAYLGSRKLLEAFTKYCSEHYTEICESMKAPEEVITGLKTYISEYLTEFVMKNGFQNTIRGKSMQMLPSTLAAIVYKVCDDHVDALVISAGDSRAYVLTPDKGLQQLSVDDVLDDMDAYSKSATMTNNIRQGKDFRINYAYYELPSECVLFVSSDGCFDYIPTPMDWEFYIEKELVNNCKKALSSKQDVLGNAIGDMLEKRVLKDDCTIAGAIVGFSNPNELGKRFFDRGSFVQITYTTPHAELEKQGAATRADVAPKIRDLEKNIGSLKTSIKKDLSDSFKKLIDYEISNPLNIPSYLLELQSALKNFDKYTEMYSIIKKEEDARKDEIELLKMEYDEKNSKLKELFKQDAGEAYLKKLTASKSKSSNLSAWIIRSAEKKHPSEAEIRDAKIKYTEAILAFQGSLNTFGNAARPDELPPREEFYKLSCQFAELTVSYEKLAALMDKSEEGAEERTEAYLNSEEYQTDYRNAMINAFADYKGSTHYSEMVMLRLDVLKLSKQKEQKYDLTDKEKLEIANKYLEKNMNAFIDRAMQDSKIVESICEKAYKELNDHQSKLAELKKQIGEADDKKRQLWQQYKTDYELFKTCSIKGGVGETDG